MSDTPRTDARMDSLKGGNSWLDYFYVLEEFARTLERELAKEKKLGQACSNDCNQVSLERNDLRAELAKWKTGGRAGTIAMWRTKAEKYDLETELRARVRENLLTIINITDGHPIDADRRDRIHQLATLALRQL